MHISKTNNTEHALCFSTNKKYLGQLNNALFSIIKNYPDHPDIHILSDGSVSARDFSHLGISQKISVHIGTVQKSLVNGLMPGKTTVEEMSSYYGRYLIWLTDIFEKYENVVYLDTDVTITESLDAFVSEETFYMVEEPNIPYNGYLDNIDSDTVQSLLLEDNLSYLTDKTSGNSGVLRIPRTFRNQEHAQLLAYFGEKYGKYSKWADQGVINIYREHIGQVLSKEHAYNFIIGYKSQGSTLKEFIVDEVYKPYSIAKIVHFAGLEAKEKEFAQTLFNTDNKLIKNTIPTMVLSLKIVKHLRKKYFGFAV